MIRKSIVTALVILITYHFVLPRLSHHFYLLLGQQRSNYLRAQQYVLDIAPETNVIVGSSLSERLNDQLLGPGYFKLTFPGGSMLTGLEMVQRAHKRPGVVLIETDVLVRKADEELLHDLFSPWLLALRRYSPVFREQGRLSNFVGGFFEACVRKSCEATSRVFSRNRSARVTQAPPGEVNSAMLAHLLPLAREASQHPPSAAEMDPVIDRLDKCVQDLSRAGSICVFFEMPPDSSLVNLPLQTTQRKAMADRFPRSKFNWITFDAGHYYHTSDGVHLVPSDADFVTESLVRQTKGLVALHSP